MSCGWLVNPTRERADGPRFRFCMLILSANEFNPATNAACNIPARLYDEEIMLYMPYREVKALLAE